LLAEYFLVFVKFAQYIATTSLNNNNRSGLTTDSVSVYSEVGKRLLNICYIKFVIKATLCHVSGGLSSPFSEKARVRFQPSVCKIYGEMTLGQVFLRAILLSLFGAVALSSMLIFHLVTLLFLGQIGEAWEPSATVEQHIEF
jgi:hypothetical protein